MNNYDFGNYICELRTRQKMSQAELAELLGVTNKAVSKWENGAAYPSSKLIYPLAKVLGVSLEDLYSAMNRDQRKKNAVRGMLDIFFGNVKLSLFIPLVFAVLLYIVFVIFGESDDKGTLMMITPIVSAVGSLFVFSVILVQMKNPMCPGWFIDLFELLLIFVIALLTITQTVSFLADVRSGYSFALLLCPSVFSTLSVVHNKRTK